MQDSHLESQSDPSHLESQSNSKSTFPHLETVHISRRIPSDQVFRSHCEKINDDIDLRSASVAARRYTEICSLPLAERFEVTPP